MNKRNVNAIDFKKLDIKNSKRPRFFMLLNLNRYFSKKIDS